MRYVTYDPATGNLTGSFLQELLAEHQANHIEATDEQAAAWTTLQANAARDGLEPRPPAPGPTLAQRRDARWEAIKVIRDTRILGGYPLTVDGVGKWFHSDLVSRSQQLALDAIATKMKAAGAADSALVSPTPWKTMDGTTVGMTVAVALQLLVAAATQEGTTFAWAEALRAAVNASDDPESVDITGGWPQTYEEA